MTTLMEQLPDAVRNGLMPSPFESSGKVAPVEMLMSACGEILDYELRPIHYQELVFLAYVHIFKIDPTTVRWSNKKSEPGGSGTIEDVRESVADYERKGMKYWHSFRYAPAPFHAVHRPSWFKDPNELHPLQHRSVRLPIEHEHWQEMFEAVAKRVPNFESHGRTLAEMEAHGQAGLLLEAVVKSWFAFNLGPRLLPASNHRKWKDFAWDDFRLLNDKGEELIIDVAKLTCDLSKKRAHLHILAEFDNQDRPDFVDVCSVKTGELWKPNGFNFESALSPIRLMVWQNMLRIGWSVSEYLEAVARHEVKRKGPVDSGVRRVDERQGELFATREGKPCPTCGDAMTPNPFPAESDYCMRLECIMAKNRR